MTNDDIRKRLEMVAAIIVNECRSDVRHGRSIADSADKVLGYLEQETINALESAAKAVEQGQKDCASYTTILANVRALIPSTGTKE